PDLILMDIILKGKMDGIDTAMRIHDDFDIPVIFITAFANNSMLQRAKTVRPYAYITKPFESSELYINIEIALYKHKIQEELRHSEEKLKMLFEFAPDAYYLNDLKGSFVDGNKAAEELTGYTREELIGKNFLTLKLLPPTQIPKAATLLAKNVLGKPTGPDEFLLNRKDGTKVAVVIKTFPVKIHDRNLVLAIARDISEQKQTDKEREKVLSEMGKRIKELHCMYAITRSLGERKTLAEILKDVTVIVPCGYQYPEITRAKVYLDNREYIATSFAETKWKQTTDIVINSECRGRIEVYYLEQRPELDEGPFLKEERNLIDGTARLLNEVITRKQTEDKLIQLASWPEQNPNPAIEVNPSGTISYLNNAAQSHFPKLKNLSFQHPILKNLDSVVCDFKKKGERSILREVDVGNKTYEEKICYMPENKSIRIFAFEITEMKRTEKKLHDLSLIDQLTGLYNRRGFFTLAEQQIGLANRTKRGFYLLFADLDKMKWINDTFGHHEGDLVLKTIALLCKKSFRKSDIIGRLGGDEFAVCAIEAQKKSAQMLIRRLKQNLYEYNKKHDYKLSLSIGTTYYDPSNPCSIDELLEQADKLMYEQKMFKQSPRVTTIEP
ncbi:diguanylate cyclase, partial [bacterium]|nr:diguanylate cyclase [bacterium]